MEEIESYYNKKSESYDKIFSTLHFKVYDAITWKYLDPYVPTDPNALVLDAGGGTGRARAKKFGIQHQCMHRRPLQS